MQSKNSSSMAKAPPDFNLIKTAHKKTSYTPHQVAEIKACMADPLYFMENYMWIQHPDPTKGRMKFTAFPFQKRLIEAYWKNTNSICLLPRQCGKCVLSQTLITIKQKLTGDIHDIPIGVFYELVRNNTDSSNISQFNITAITPNLPKSQNIQQSLIHSVSNTVDRKFIDTVQLEDWEILTDSDWQPCTEISKTIKYQVYKLVLDNGYHLECADTHIVFDQTYNEIFVKDLQIGDFIRTNNGTNKVVSIIKTEDFEHMYDVTVDSHGHRYYSNGILSHNTTTAAGFILWYAMFNDDVTILIAANKFRSATEIMDRVKFSYEELPDWLRAGVNTYNVQDIRFDTRSRIKSTTTTPDSGRGMAISLLYLDEFSFVNPRIAEDFWTAMSPTLATGGKCIITSTPNSDEDKFAEIWFGANKTIDEYGNEIPGGLGVNGFKAVTAHYSEVPGRDEEWAKKERYKIGVDKFDREYGLCFLSADETLINAVTLLKLQGVDPLFKTNEIRWYDTVHPNKTYLVALDPSAGVGKDASAIEVFSLPDMQQVAEWTHNRTSIPNQVKIMQNIVNFIYNEMRKSSEQQGEPDIYFTLENNSWGEAALLTVDEIGEEHFNAIMMHEPKAKGNSRHRKGLNTNGRTKALACTKFKSLLESEKLKIASKMLVRQIKFFVSKGDSFSGKSGENDDCVMAMLLCIRMMQLVTRWDENIGNLMREDFIDETCEAPMPFSIGF